MRHPRARAWPAVAGLAAGGLAVAGARTATGRPVISATTLASAGVGAAASGLIVYEWLTPRSWIYGPVFWHARTEERVVALTFDDGPCHPYTTELMEVLRSEQVQATFFMVGNNVVREPNLAAEVASEHAVGNHTFTHPHLTWSRPGTVKEELERGQEAIHEATGVVPSIFRVPHGWYGPQVISGAGDLGMHCIGWSVMAWDWNKPPRETIQRSHPARSRPRRRDPAARRPGHRGLPQGGPLQDDSRRPPHHRVPESGRLPFRNRARAYGPGRTRPVTANS